MYIDAARETDLGAITAIYNDVIATSTAVFHDVQVDVEDRHRWWSERRERGFPVLVAREVGQVLGFASFGDFRAWPGYRTTVEHTVHVDAAHRRQGIGRQLVETLIRDAQALGMHVMIAGLDAANEASLALHTRLGFVEVGRFPEIARKFHRWIDLVLLQLILDEAPAASES